MPANLTPEYKAAEAAFRKARDPRERLEWLREMLRTIPKHKGTDHLQGDIKRRIKELSEELERPQRGGARGGPAVVIRPEGAAQIALIGPPNAGKSSLHARLTGSAAPAAPYPFTTQYPEPGMMPHENISLQLVDLPAVSPEHPVPWLASTLQTADAALLVVDLCDPACLEQVETVRTILRERRVTLTDRWEPAGESPVVAAEGDEDPFALRLPTLLVANKVECLADACLTETGNALSITASGHVLVHQRVDHESIFDPRAWLTTGHLSLDQPHDGRPDLRRGHRSPDRDHYP